jgi:hypothetical protein
MLIPGRYPATKSLAETNAMLVDAAITQAPSLDKSLS